MAESEKVKLGLLLFELGELFKNPPITIDYFDWTDRVDHVMDEIGRVSVQVFERIEALVSLVVLKAKEHVDDIDGDAMGNEIEQSSIRYYEQVGFLTSEINTIKGLNM